MLRVELLRSGRHGRLQRTTNEEIEEGRHGQFEPSLLYADFTIYLRPKKAVGADSSWYDCVPVGKGKLATYMQTMCKEAGLSEKKTNHSLRATGASALFNAGVSEKLIRDVTGHRSNALQLYERPSQDQKQYVSSVLVQGQKSFADKEKENVPLPQQSSPTAGNVCGSLFSGFCSVNISPHNIIVTVGPSVASNSVSKAELDQLLDGIDIDQLLQ